MNKQDFRRDPEEKEEDTETTLMELGKVSVETKGMVFGNEFDGGIRTMWFG